MKKRIMLSIFALYVIMKFVAAQYWTDELIGTNYFREADMLGQDYSVCIIDNGVNYELQALGGGIGPNYKIKNGYNTVTEIENDVLQTIHDHGTTIAQIVSSDGNVFKGKDPESNLLIAKVTRNSFGYEDNNILNSYGDARAAFKWCIKNGGII